VKKRPFNPLVQEEEDKYDERNGVKEDISDQRPSGQTGKRIDRFII